MKTCITFRRVIPLIVRGVVTKQPLLQKIYETTPKNLDFDVFATRFYKPKPNLTKQPNQEKLRQYRSFICCL